MKYEVRLIDLAQEDLQDVADYLSNYSSNAALNFIDELDARLTLISEFPDMFPIYAYDQRFRKSVIGKYSLFYIPSAQEKVINVIRIIHSSMDIKRELANIKQN